MGIETSICRHRWGWNLCGYGSEVKLDHLLGMQLKSVGVGVFSVPLQVYCMHEGD